MTASTVSEYLEADHRRLDAIAVAVVRLVQAESYAAAREKFATFVAGLGRHIEAEEAVLFPAFEQLTTVRHGPTVVMRAEHLEIRRRMGAVASALIAEEPERTQQALRALAEILSAHNLKEERVLYPMADDALGTPGARAALVRDMERLSIEAS